MNIPNMLTMLRIAMVPAFILLYFSYINHGKWWAVIVVVLAYITDVLDGFIARRCKIITDFGKVMDPFADKLMQVAIFVCVTISIPEILPALIILIVKDILLAIGAKILYNKDVVRSSNWFGKIASFVTLFGLIFILIYTNLAASGVFVNNPKLAVSITLAIIIIANITALISYVPSLTQVLKASKDGKDQQTIYKK